MKFKIPKVLLIILILSGIHSQPNSNQTIFLNLKLINGRVHLVEYNIETVSLKIPKQILLINDYIYCKVMNENDDMLFETVIPDPSDIRYESIDSLGLFVINRVKLDSTNFTVRIPYNISVYKADFSKINNVTNKYDFAPSLKHSMGSIIIKLK